MFDSKTDIYTHACSFPLSTTQTTLFFSYEFKLTKQHEQNRTKPPYWRLAVENIFLHRRHTHSIFSQSYRGRKEICGKNINLFKFTIHIILINKFNWNFMKNVNNKRTQCCVLLKKEKIEEKKTKNGIFFHLTSRRKNNLQQKKNNRKFFFTKVCVYT